MALADRVRQWDEIADCHYIQDLDDLQICEVADYFRVPPSWVRAHMSPWELGQWAEYQDIKQERMDEQLDD